MKKLLVKAREKAKNVSKRLEGNNRKGHRKHKVPDITLQLFI